jgi:large subunit ribosomal protein L10
MKDRLAKAKSVVLADYKGLTVAQIGELRKQVTATGAEMKVTKNSLIKIALKESKYPVAELENMTGPTTIMFGLTDEISPIKAMADFAKTVELPKFKAGFLGLEFINADKVKQLANLPGKDILIAQVVGGLKSPLYGMVNVLQGNLRKLVYVLKAVEAKKN